MATQEHRQVRLGDGEIEVVLLPDLGARLHRLRAFGQEVLRTPPDPSVHHQDPFFWGAYIMAPWGGRIEAGPQLVGTQRVDLPANFTDGSAIHGQVYARPWETRGDGVFQVRAGGDGWPWTYEVNLQVSVAHPTLTLHQEILNLSHDPMPAGLGIHPWYHCPVQVAIRGRSVFPDNHATQPRPEPVHGPLDLQSLGAMALDLDGTWTDLADPPLVLRWPESGVQLTMRTTPPAPFVVAASPSELDAIAIEPQTHAPQGLRRTLGGEMGALTMLGPAEVLELTVALTFERLAGTHAEGA
jgi:aldose 1-epimerase